jgi:Flp pilus assembly protein TadD
MKKVFSILVVLALFMIPVTAFAGEGPLALPDGANPEANMHNNEGIKHWGKGHFDVALGHFQEASAIDASSGEVHFNEAISLDKVGKHGDATMHFKAAFKRAGGNKKILESPILKAHIGH